jgi:non-heme Fe2+,alpha-ketoglutarate-dependent halogenase
MPKVLTVEQTRRYKEDGFLFPFDLYTQEEADGLAAKYAELEHRHGGELQKTFRIKAQLPFPWLCDIVRHPRLLDAVEDLIGPNVICWGSSLFAKKARDPRYVAWHKDTSVYGFEPAESLTAWVAFNDCTDESGCVRYLPGSGGDVVQHEIRSDPNNLLSMGQHAIGIDEGAAVSAYLRAGQVVFHDEHVLHASGPNRADHPRIGFSIHYIAPHVRETRFAGATGMLVRGVDEFGHWVADPEPGDDFDPVCIKVMEDTRAKYFATDKKF